MTLPGLTLDDLTYEDLRELAMRNIPAASRGRWTHHAPVDAGITLLELFAFLLEQQLFVLDQVPDSMVGALLALLGDGPRPTRAARTVFALGEGGPAGFVSLGEGEAFRPLSNALAGLDFTTRESALLPPVAGIGVRVDGDDVSDSLARGRPVPMFANAGGPGRLDLDLRLTEPFAPDHAGEPLALALILDGNLVAPEWDREAVDVPPPGAFVLRWRAGAAGGRIAFQDGTGGIRRSGLVRFPVPSGFAGHDRLALRLETALIGHAEPPRLARVLLGAAIAEHRWRRTAGPDGPEARADPVWLELKAAIDDWRPNSGQVLALPRELGPVFEDGLLLRLLDRSGEWRDWTPAPDLTPLGPEDRRFTVDRPAGRLLFGDGYEGRVPAPAGDVSLSADLGGGIAGNHAPGLEWRGLAGDRADLRLRSAAEAIGGAEAESVAEARARVGASLSERHRAVTAADYLTLLETAPGIALHRGHVAVGFDPDFPCRYVSDSVAVFVVPRTGPDVPAPRADEGAMAAIRSRLEAARMLTTRISVLRPVFRPVALEVSVAASAGDSDSFAERLRPLFFAYLHPSLGGPDSLGWPFGRPLRPSELVRVAQDELGPDALVERVAIRLEDMEDGAEACTDVAIGEHELVRLSRLRVRLSTPRSAGATL